MNNLASAKLSPYRRKMSRVDIITVFYTGDHNLGRLEEDLTSGNLAKRISDWSKHFNAVDMILIFEWRAVGSRN
jgi:hypothetical protein